MEDQRWDTQGDGYRWFSVKLDRDSAGWDIREGRTLQSNSRLVELLGVLVAVMLFKDGRGFGNASPFDGELSWQARHDDLVRFH